MDASPARHPLAPVTARTGPAPAWRLTRRGRRLLRAAALGAVAVLVAVVASVLLAASPAPGAPEAAAGDAGVRGPGYTEVVVAPGESLWELAARHAPGTDPREVVLDIEQANGLEPGSVVAAGARLRVPLG